MSNGLLHESESSEFGFAPAFAASAAGHGHAAVPVLIQLASAFAGFGVYDWADADGAWCVVTDG